MEEPYFPLLVSPISRECGRTRTRSLSPALFCRGAFILGRHLAVHRPVAVVKILAKRANSLPYDMYLMGFAAQSPVSHRLPFSALVVASSSI